MTCAHCSVQSGPKIREEPTREELIATLHSAADAGIQSVQITGGEPMIREDIVFGLENAPEAFVGLLQGKNFGKLVVQVAHD